MTKFRNGERYPVLLDPDGLPLWYPTLFVTTQVRNASKASNTMKAVLGCIRILLNWADSKGMSLVRRFADRKWLRNQEIESLFEFTRRRFGTTPSNSGLFLPHSRARASARLINNACVLNDAHYIRLTYAAKYVDFLAKIVLEELGGVSDIDQRSISEMVAKIEAHRPIKRASSRIYARMGLDDATKNALYDLIRPDNPLNPFEESVRQRNEAIVYTLIDLGPRAGELLQAKTTDFDFYSNEAAIGTRRDDPIDPRIDEPAPKTLDRRIGVKSETIKKIHNYVLKDRRHIVADPDNKFIFVTHKCGPYQGKPLSQRGLNLIFERLRKSQPTLPANFSPHSLRHTSNDEFSDLSDEMKWTEAREDQMRSYKYGWRFGSGTATTYNRRRIEREVRKAASLQQRRVVTRREQEE